MLRTNMLQYDPELEGLHRRSSEHRQQVAASAVCGCFYCRTTFDPGEIEEWVDEVGGAGQTALCPRCGIDSVLPFDHADAATDEILRRMHAYWFS